MAARWNPFDTPQLPPGALSLPRLDSKLITNLSRSVVPVSEICDLLISRGALSSYITNNLPSHSNIFPSGFRCDFAFDRRFRNNHAREGEESVP